MKVYLDFDLYLFNAWLDNLFFVDYCVASSNIMWFIKNSNNLSTEGNA